MACATPVAGRLSRTCMVKSGETAVAHHTWVRVRVRVRVRRKMARVRGRVRVRVRREG